MRKDKKITTLINIISSLPSDDSEISARVFSSHGSLNLDLEAEMALASALKIVAKGTKYENLTTEIIDKCCLITDIEKENL